MTKYAFVTVSNRLPISASKENGELSFSISSGGLATAMASLSIDNAAWVGWCGVATEDLNSKEKAAIKEEFSKHNALPVFLTKKQIELYYDGYANDTLWPLFHYFQSVAKYEDEYFEAYSEVNEAFAKVVKQYAESDARIWIHDYHLMLLPSLIRSRIKDATIGFFLHIPFPSFEIFRLLPERTMILRGLLGADVIGFHVFDYARHFSSSVQRLLGITGRDGFIEYEGRIIRIGTYPIGIDYKKFVKTEASKAVKKQRSLLAKNYKKQQLILSIDRLDYSKGIPQRLEAFRQLLANHPEYHGKIRLLMIAVPSRTSVESYQRLRDVIEQTVSRINGTYGTVDWAPISYQFQNRPFDEIVALYAAADVMLVTPIRDGMNLVAKEYVAAKQHDSGVLVLSEMAGAVDELPEALAINPNSSRSIADALHTALSMPRREQKKRMDSMQKRIKEFDIHAWGESFVKDLERAAAGENKPLDKSLTGENRQRLKAEFIAAKRRLVILDYDGTIKPFLSSPSTLVGFPSLKLQWTLRRLALDRSNTVAIVSGRVRQALVLWFRGMRIELAAEHGAWIRFGGKWRRTNNDFKDVKRPLLQIMNEYTSRTTGSDVEEKEYSLVWHYRNVEPELAYRRASKLRQELQNIAPAESVGVFSGDKIIEVRPLNINKGKVVEQLIQRHNPDFIFCAGDDYTDEDMFKVLGSDAFTIKVGPGDTSARYRLDDASELIDLVEELSQQSTVSTVIKKLK
jgi:trehalose 6-phosphate synthase/phosphatase